MKHAQNAAIWVFDSQCVLCDGGVQYTLKHEKTAHIHFVSIQSPSGRSLAFKHGVDPDDPQTLLSIERGEAFEKSDAVIALARQLDGPARIIVLAKVIPKGIRDFVYGIVAKHRYRIFGKQDMCILPDAKNRHRFTV